jgi:competence protein ComFC
VKKIDWELWKRAAVDLFFPGDCPICEGAAYQDEVSFACLSCLDSIAWIKHSRCKLCGMGMDGLDYAGLVCKNCRESSPVFSAGRTLFHLNPAGRKLVHQIKYHGDKRILQDIPFFLERAPQFLEFITGAVLIPVPLHKKKLRKRRFNQSLWIAEAFARQAGVSTVAYDCMLRTRNTPSQTELDRNERRKNVKNAFALKEGTCLDGFDRVVLVDDVYTTGATLDACASALLERGVRTVEVATLGHG